MASNGCRSQGNLESSQLWFRGWGPFYISALSRSTTSQDSCVGVIEYSEILRECVHTRIFSPRTSASGWVWRFFGLDNGSKTHIYIINLLPNPKLTPSGGVRFVPLPPLALAIAMGAAATTTKRAAIEVSRTDSDSEYQRIIKGYRLLLCTLM